MIEQFEVASRWLHATPPLPPITEPGFPGIPDPAHAPMGDPLPIPGDPGQPLPTPKPPGTPIAPPGIPQPPAVTSRYLN